MWDWSGSSPTTYAAGAGAPVISVRGPVARSGCGRRPQCRPRRPTRPSPSPRPRVSGSARPGPPRQSAGEGGAFRRGHRPPSLDPGPGPTRNPGATRRGLGKRWTDASAPVDRRREPRGGSKRGPRKRSRAAGKGRSGEPARGGRPGATFVNPRHPPTEARRAGPRGGGAGGPRGEERGKATSSCGVRSRPDPRDPEPPPSPPADPSAPHESSAPSLIPCTSN